MKEFVRVRIDGNVQPVAVIVEVNHGFAERTVIRLFPHRRL